MLLRKLSPEIIVRPSIRNVCTFDLGIRRPPCHTEDLLSVPLDGNVYSTVSTTPNVKVLNYLYKLSEEYFNLLGNHRRLILVRGRTGLVYDWWTVSGGGTTVNCCLFNRQTSLSSIPLSQATTSAYSLDLKQILASGRLLVVLHCHSFVRRVPQVGTFRRRC